ncbi:hypothetical protein DIPPA_54995 [Diplonema papillatum]|nr:hypothetical protein DIPPA_54995 [Diplonema papillatum]
MVKVTVVAVSCALMAVCVGSSCSSRPCGAYQRCEDASTSSFTCFCDGDRTKSRDGGPLNDRLCLNPTFDEWIGIPAFCFVGLYVAYIVLHRFEYVRKRLAKDANKYGSTVESEVPPIHPRSETPIAGDLSLVMSASVENKRRSMGASSADSQRAPGESFDAVHSLNMTDDATVADHNDETLVSSEG